MPDDMLVDAITIAKKALDEHDFETQGVDVRISNCHHPSYLTVDLIDCKDRKEVHG